MPILLKHAKFLSRLGLVLALALPGALPAEDDVTEDMDPARTESCDPGLAAEDVARPSGQVAANEPEEACEQLPQELTEEARQEITVDIAENTQNAFTLRTLLLGRNYVFFGRAGVEYAIYSGDIPSSENGGELRRLRFGIAGLATFTDQVSYKAEFDLTDGTNNFSDLYVQWDSQKYGSLRVGNQRVSQNLSAISAPEERFFSFLRLDLKARKSTSAQVGR